MGLFKKDLTIRLNGDMGENLIERVSHQAIKADTYVIVPVNTEAVLVVNGTDQRILQSGKHEIAKPKGEKKIDIDVTFINTEVRMQSMWGTPSRIEFIDGETEMPAYLGASGTVVFEINNTMKVYKRLLGTGGIADVKALIAYLKSTISVNVKDIFARKLIAEKVNYFDLADNVKELAIEIKAELMTSFEEYGVAIIEFTVDNLVFPDEIKQIRSKLMAEKYVLKQKGTSHEELRAQEIEKETQERESNERITISVAESARPIVMGAGGSFCADCGVSMPIGSKFCSSCGSTQGSSRICKKCNTVVIAGSNFCQKCGEQV